jgi:serine/threonine-protein kinase RsbT
VEREVTIPIRTDSDVVAARQQGRGLAQDLTFSATEVTLIATAISEVARNIITYAGEGEITVMVVEREGRQGIRVVASDTGPGIVNVQLALQDGYSSGQGMGLGLPGARRLMDDFHVETAPGAGTTVTMIKWETRIG